MNPLSRSLILPNGCIEWQGHITYKGYGQLNYQGKRWYAHRLSYTLNHGHIPKGMQVCHRCDNPACINPEHLFLGTNQDNVNDKVEKKRIPQGEDHCRSKFSNAQREAIRADTRTQVEIAQAYNTTQPAISRIKRKKP